MRKREKPWTLSPPKNNIGGCHSLLLNASGGEHGGIQQKAIPEKKRDDNYRYFNMLVRHDRMRHIHKDRQHPFN